MPYQYPLRAYGDRGRGKVHAPHPESALRPLCRKTPIDWRGPRYSPVLDEYVNCRRCLRLQGNKLPEPKRLGERAAVGKALVELGLRRERDFRIRTRYLPLSETGGVRCVDYTVVYFNNREAEQTVRDNAQALIEKLWTNPYGRHDWGVWLTGKRKDGSRRVEVTTQWYSPAFQEHLGYEQVTSTRDLPESVRNLYWGQELAVEADIEKEVRK